MLPIGTIHFFTPSFCFLFSLVGIIFLFLFTLKFFLFFYGIIPVRIESSLLLSQCSLRLPAPATRSPELRFLPSDRNTTKMSALFSWLMCGFNITVQSRPSYDMFCDFKSTLLGF